ncbi:MAG: hypothetical protein ACKVPX_06575 [Myxococcaceae bacterium]
MNLSATLPAEVRSLWKNPYVLAFVLGVVTLTALPFAQRFFLRAPPPLRALPDVLLRESNGALVPLISLRGKIWMVGVFETPCQSACTQRLAALERVSRHVDDLNGAVASLALHSFADGNPPHGPSLSLAASPKTLRQLGLNEFDRFALIDQNGALRGFWPTDEAGQGNFINAARLLARYGPNP